MMTRLQNFLHAIGMEIQQVENTAEELAQNLNLDRAQGVVLDLYGDDIEISRPVGMTDDNYRILIRAMWSILRSNGTPDEMIEAARVVTDATVIRIHEPLAGEGILVTMFINSDSAKNAFIIYKTKAAGIPLELTLGVAGGVAAPNLVSSEDDLPESFYPSATGVDEGLGFSELDCAHVDAEIMLWYGGQITELITQ